MTETDKTTLERERFEEWLNTSGMREEMWMWAAWQARAALDTGEPSEGPVTTFVWEAETPPASASAGKVDPVAAART